MVRPLDEVIEKLEAQGVEVSIRKIKDECWRSIDIHDNDITGIFCENGWFVLYRGKKIVWSMGQRSNVDEDIKNKYIDIFFVVDQAGSGRAAQNTQRGTLAIEPKKV